MRFLKLLLLFFSLQLSAQQGGMWIPSLLQGMNESEMQSLGSKLSAKDIYDVNKSSLKDAIVHFDGRCTGEIISSKGLILTNHHCGKGQIQTHSSVEKDYLKNGFWAMNMAEELPNDDMYVEFIVRIEDVTKQMMKGVTANMEEKELQSLLGTNSSAIEREAKKEAWQDTRIKSFYKGNQYFLFVTERYEDIRLVGAPPTSIGEFGVDTDNWVWPRHAGDFSLFRIYADKNNRPAKYSKDNVPFKPKHFLPVSLDGVSENDFTLVFGFPGSTDEYLPAVAVEQIVKKINPSNVAIREAALKEIDGFMMKNDTIRIQYAHKQAQIANTWKRWKGEILGIENRDVLAKKRAFEEKFTKRLKTQEQKAKYAHILPELGRLYKDIEDTSVKRNAFVEVFVRTNELMQVMLRLSQMENASLRGEEAFERARESMMNRLKGFYKDYKVEVDRAVFNAVMPLYTYHVNDSIYATTAFTDPEKAAKILYGNSKEVLSKLNEDPAYAYAKPLIEDFYTNIDPRFQELNNQINALETLYMKAMMEVLPNERYYPDANSTLRVSYGKVTGYEPRDAVYYEPVSYLEGVAEKHIPGDYEFEAPKKLLELYANKDYGQYADKTGKVPVCFIGTNHTTGGNSGSPAIDAHGNLIGLNFDRVWEGTMSDMYFDPLICRNIMVDARYILFIIDKFAGATHLIDELELVHPKKK